MTVRRLRRDEVALFTDLRLRALADAPEAFAHTYAEISVQTATYWEDMTRSVTEPGRHVMFVAEHGGVPVGMAFGLRPRDGVPVPHVGGMWVDPAARLRGSGRALTDAVVDWAREQGFERIGLWVTESNAPAIALYVRMGFAPTGRTDRFPPNPELAIVEMERAL